MKDNVNSCGDCRLACEYKQWTTEREGQKVLTARELKTFSKRNPQCPKDKAVHDELMTKCETRGTYDKNLEVCLVCKNRTRIIISQDLKNIPSECPLLDEIKELLPKLSELQTPFAESMDQLQESMLILAKVGTTVRQQLLEVTQTMIESIGFLGESEFIAFEKEIGFIPSFLALPEVKRLYNLWKAGKKEEVSNTFVNLLHKKENVDSLLSEISNHQSFKLRINLIRDAFYAHLEGNYSLSIPVLWSQLDGIFITKFGSLIGTYEKCKECGRSSSPNLKSIAKKLTENKGQKGKFFWAAFLGFVETIYGKERSKILHGLDTDYPNIKRSTMLVLSMYELYELIQYFDNDSSSSRTKL
jgi:hypothetical protein